MQKLQMQTYSTFRKKGNTLARKTVTDDFQVFSERLSALMKDRGATQQDLADALGVKRQTISLYKSGQSMPDAKMLRDISLYFGVSSDFLIGLSDIKSFGLHQRMACELTGLSDEAVTRVIALGAPGKKAADTKYREAMNLFVSNEKFIPLICELKRVIDSSRVLGIRLESLLSYSTGDLPENPKDLLAYSMEHWDYRWETGEDYSGFGPGFDVVDAERERKARMYYCFDIFQKIIGEISESEIVDK